MRLSQSIIFNKIQLEWLVYKTKVVSAEKRPQYKYILINIMERKCCFLLGLKLYMQPWYNAYNLSCFTRKY